MTELNEARRTAAVALIAAAVSAAALALVATSARGATVVGTDPSLPLDGASITCAAPLMSCTYSQNRFDGTTMVVPVAGVITSWRFRTPAVGSVARLRVMRPPALFVSSSPPDTFVDGLDQVRGPLPTRQAVQAGDRLGLRLSAPPEGWTAQRPAGPVTFTDGDNSYQYWGPDDPEDGQSEYPDGAGYGSRLLLQAVVEPDADGDGFGDETQDGCPQVPGPTCTADLDVVLGAQATAVRGATVPLRATVVNAGPDASAPVSLALTLPDGLRPEAVPAGCTESGGQITCEVGAVAAGAERVVDLPAALVSTGPQAVAASATAASSDPDGAAANAIVEGLEPPVAIAAPPRDLTPPALGALRVRSPSSAKRSLSLTLSEPARLALVLQRLSPGRRAGRRCVAPRGRTGRRCVRRVRVGTASVDAAAGAVGLALRGRLPRRGTLFPGRYRLAVTARDALGNVSAPTAATFRVRRAK